MNTDQLKKVVEIFENSQLENMDLETEEMKIRLKKGQVSAVSTHSDSVPKTEGILIRSPLVGTFYSRPTPQKDRFVSVGQMVKEGDVVGIIEAMKVMNEIKATASGLVAEILVEDDAMVEFDQPLLRIEEKA